MVRDCAVVLPDYGCGTLADVIPSMTGALGTSSANVLDLPPVSRCVVLLVDGLGQRLLAENAEDAPFLSSLPGRVLTVGVPSTTATSLTSFGTGLPPGQHGVVGYTSRIPGTNRLLNALKWDARVDPAEWQPHQTAFDRAARAGLVTTVVHKREFGGSGLTLASQRGADFVGADSAGERLAAVASASQVPGSLTYVYDGDVDWAGHRDGCRSEAWRHQLAISDAFAARLREAVGADTMLVVTADHGMVDLPADGRIDVDDEPDLMRGVHLFGGEARLRHLYCQAGAVEEVLERWRARLSTSALVVTREQAIAAGWFGPVRREVAPRLGDVLVACLGPVGVFSRTRFPMEKRLVGFHGSLTADEMLVPLLVDIR